MKQEQEQTLEAQPAPQTTLKTDVLAAIIDGPVDADKADYIIRDSARCELPYGGQLDIERLLRVLTVAIIQDVSSAARKVTLGVYDKGLVSAHAFGLARYELLSTVYWHHTARIAKAMLQYSTAIALPPEVFWVNSPDGERKQLEIREQLIAFIKSLVPYPGVDLQHVPKSLSEPGDQIDLAAPPPVDVMHAVVGPLESPVAARLRDVPVGWYPGVSATDWKMLEWIAELPAASQRSRNLVRSLETRRLYKRVATFARGWGYDEIITALEELNWPDRVKICEALHERFAKRVREKWPTLDTSNGLTASQFEIASSANLLALVDVPLPQKKVGFDRPLGVVPELKEKSYHEDSRYAKEDTKWRELMESMVKGIAPIRVLCHPDVRHLVSAAYAPVVEPNIADVLRKVLGLIA